MKIGVLDLVVDTVVRTTINSLYTARFRRQFYGIIPQTVAVWCRQMGHEVHYTTYYGQADPKSLLPDDLDIVFIAAFTQASALAYALAKLYRSDGTLTVLGGPHAKSFPEDSLRFFDYVVQECDKSLVKDIIDGQFDPPAILSTGKPLTELPTVAERLPEIRKAAFSGDRPGKTAFIPVMASIGCPYHCDFCMDWNRAYLPLSRERLKADLDYLSASYPDSLLVFHDPNFGVRFDEVMQLLETIPAGRRNRYLMECSLAILKPERLSRLQETGCIFVAPGIESWMNYSNKAGAGAKKGREKLEDVIRQFKTLQQYIPDSQANFIFGTDADCGPEPAGLTREFIQRMPDVWPALNIPVPFKGTPFFDQLWQDGRILKAMPLSFYYRPYLVIRVKNYTPIEFYDHLIELYTIVTSYPMILRRLFARSAPALKIIYTVRALHLRQELAELRRVRDRLRQDPALLAFHEGESKYLPEFYQHRFDNRLGHYAALISREERIPVLESLPSPVDHVQHCTRPVVSGRPATAVLDHVE